MRILVLGRAIVEAALHAGDAVTTLTRTTPPPGASEGRIEALFGDRTASQTLESLATRDFDAVFDTWSGAPCVVRSAVGALAGHAPYYAYVSTMSVYREPMPAGSNEEHPTVVADPGAGSTGYPADNRGAELAVIEGFGGACLLARAGLILGPHEGPGRLPWWLSRIARGGDVLAPGPAELPLQYVDARDLAAWMLRCAHTGATGAFNTVSESGFTTMGALLETCAGVTGIDASLVWVDPEFVLSQGIEPWVELPIWLPPGPDHDAQCADTSRAAAAGLVCRPTRDTIFDTWQWMQDGGAPRPVPGRAAAGLEPAKERAALAAWRAR